jgi:hypothetical protein
MLKTIAIVTLVVRSLGTVEPAYESHLDYTVVERGAVARELARAWDAPAMIGQRYLLMQAQSGAAVYLRFIEAARGTPEVSPFMTHGWNATEILVTDPDAMARRLENTPFRVIGPPADLMPGDKAPRAMQVLGPANEVLYMTRIIPGGSGFDLGSARSPVDRVFIAVVGGPSIEALRAFYGTALGMPLGDTAWWKIGVLARAHQLPAESRFPLAVAIMPKNFLVELDGYPPGATPRPRARRALPGGMAMVSFTSDRLASLNVKWRSRPRAIQAFPYAGRRAAVTIGPAGEWIEVIETPVQPDTR